MPTALIINKSRIPIIRAGLSNILLIIGVIGSFLACELLTTLNASPIVIISIIMFIVGLTILFYNRSISKLIFINERTMEITNSFTTSRINIENIEKMRILGIPTSVTIFVKIKLRSRYFSRLYYVIAASTNKGTYDQTKEYISSICSIVEKSTE